MNLLHDELTKLFDAYLNVKTTPASLAVYIEDLEDLPLDLTVQAIRVCRREQTDFFPTIGKIRSLVIETAAGIPSVEAAEADVRRTIKNYRQGEGYAFSHPLITEAVKAVDWYLLRTDDKGFAWKRLKEVYGELRTAQLRAYQAGTVALPMGGELLEVVG